MDKRIVIVCNFSRSQDQGLLKTLGATYRFSPFVQTYLYDFKNNDYSAKITQSNPYLYIKETGVSTRPIRDWRILLIADSLETKDYPEDIFDSDTLVMYHTVPIDVAEFLDRKAASAQKKQGEHEPYEECGYPLLNRVVAAYDLDGNFRGQDFNDALERLVDWFGVDEVHEAKLNLLHDCLSTVPDSLDELLDAEYKTAFDIFRKKAAGRKWPDKKYISALTELRRSLLGS